MKHVLLLRAIILSTASCVIPSRYSGMRWAAETTKMVLDWPKIHKIAGAISPIYTRTEALLSLSHSSNHLNTMAALSSCACASLLVRPTAAQRVSRVGGWEPIPQLHDLLGAMGSPGARQDERGCR